VKQPAHEHEFEAAPGLPEALPRDEKMLWQGAPQWHALAHSAMHVRGLSVYFALMLVWRVATVLADGGSALDVLTSVAVFLPLALLALGILLLLAWLASRNTVYTITDKRVVMRIGIVLTVTFNLPLRMVESASLRRDSDGTGDIALVLAPPDRIAWLHLWPHVRPWHLRRPQPVLRAIADSERVAALLIDAIVALPADASMPSRPLVAGPRRAVDEKPGASPTGAGPLTA